MGRTLAVCALVAACAARGVTADLDPGGVAFEWPPAGGPPIERQTVGGNLVPAGDFETDWERMGALGWAAGTWTGGPTREPYPGSASNGLAPGAGRAASTAFRLTIAPGSHRVISSYLRVVLPVQEHGLRISLWARSGDPAPPAGTSSVTLRAQDDRGGVLDTVERSFTPGPDWRQFTLDFPLPRDTQRASVQIMQRGPGECLLDDVTALQFRPDPELRIAPCVTGRLDGIIGLALADLYVGRFLLTNESGRTVTDPALELELPEGIEVIPANTAMAAGYSSRPSARAGYVVHVQRFPWLDAYTKALRPFSLRWRICLRSHLQPAAGDLPAWARVSGSDYTGPWCPLALRPLPPIEPVSPPRRLLIGGGFDADLEGEAARAFVDSYRRWGANLAAPRTYPSQDLLALLRQGDLYLILDNRTWQNAHAVLGFHRGEPAPEEALWIDAGGQPDRSSLVCPEYIAARGQRFMQAVLPELRRAFVAERAFDAWATNWEPTVHYARGCFCPRCRAAFARFVGAPEAELLALPALDILTTYRERWRQFRAAQSGRVVQLALEIFAQLGAERGQPIPCLLWCAPALFTDQGGEDGMRESLRQAGGVGSWCYAGWRVEEGRWSWSDPFYEETGREIDPDLCHLRTAEAVAEITRRLRVLTGREDFRYMHSVLGHYFNDYFSTPEESTLDLLAAALARPWAIRPPYFPDGLDHRYAAGFAEAMRLISAHEDIILDGERVPVQITPLSARGKEADEQGGLWARAFEHRGRRLYCLLNFARREPALFRLAIAHPPQNAAAPLVLWDPVHRRHYSSADAPALTAADLHDGVTLHLGAARARFLVLEPHSAGVDYGRHVDCRELTPGAQ